MIIPGIGKGKADIKEISNQLFLEINVILAREHSCKSSPSTRILLQRVLGHNLQLFLSWSYTYSCGFSIKEIFATAVDFSQNPETINGCCLLLLEKSIMDGVYVIFILVEHLLSLLFYFYILEELYLMVHTFIIQILGFQEFFFSSS